MIWFIRTTLRAAFVPTLAAGLLSLCAASACGPAGSFSSVQTARRRAVLLMASFFSATAPLEEHDLGKITCHSQGRPQWGRAEGNGQ